ncbi:MAG: hypothetical protein CMD34_03300, partial [Flavobacteriales bacterium]|nr:hypothetical protein [Flavobacteriales bacterium]
ENYFANCGGGSSSSTSSLDSTTIANMIANSGGSRCDFRFPEGLDGDFVSFNPLVNPYTVPSNKRLYILHSGSPTSRDFVIDGNETGMATDDIILVDENQVVSSLAGFSEYINGILVDKNSNIESIILDWPDNITGSYSVPNNKKLVILSAGGSSNYQ